MLQQSLEFETVIATTDGVADLAAPFVVEQVGELAATDSSHLKDMVASSQPVHI